MRGGLQSSVNVDQASVNRAILALLERLNDSFADFAASQFDTSCACQDVEEVMNDDSPPLDTEEDVDSLATLVCECTSIERLGSQESEVLDYI